MVDHSAILGLIGIGYDKKSSFLRGPAQAPALIRHILHDGSSNEYAENGINPFPSIKDCGDWSGTDYHDIENFVTENLKKNRKLITLGGDHSITYPIVKAYAQNRKPFDILLFDAHGDLYDEFEGDRFSHACPFARIMESGLCQCLYQVGIRTLTPHQRSQIKKWNIQCLEMKDIDKLSLITFTRPLYISIDLDAFDPAYAPGVSHQEPGGLVPRMIIDFIHQISVPIIGADIVEYNPLRDQSFMTAYLAAKLLKEVASEMVD